MKNFFNEVKEHIISRNVSKLLSSKYKHSKFIEFPTGLGKIDSRFLLRYKFLRFSSSPMNSGNSFKSQFLKTKVLK